MKRAIALALLVGIRAGLSAAAEDPAPLTVDALQHLATFPLYSILGSLSPDGRFLAYALRTCNPAVGEGSGLHGPTGMRAMNEGCSDLWIVDTRTGASERISNGKGMAEDAAWSPDGSRLAFYAALDGTAHLWIWERAAKKLRRAGDAIVRPSVFDDGAHPRWTPDGKHVLALVLPEGETVDAANARVRSKKPARDPGTSARSDVVVYRSAASTSGDSAKAEAPAADRDEIHRETSDLAKIATADLAAVDVATGETRRLARGKAILWYAASPDGKLVAFTHITGARQGKVVARVYDIEVASMEGGAARSLARDVYPDQGVCTWSPDGKRLAYASGLGKEAVADVHLLDVSTGEDRRLTPDAPSDRISWQYRLVPLWAPDGRSLLFSAFGGLWRIPADGGKLAATGGTDGGRGRDVVQLLEDASENRFWTTDGGRTATVTTRNPVTKEVGFFRVELASGRLEKLREETKAYGFVQPLVAADGSFVVYAAEDARHPKDLWGAGPGLRDARPLTHANPQVEKITLGAARLVDYLGNDGKPLQGSLLLPSDYREGTRVPLIVQLYPGEWKHSDYVYRFGLGDTSGEFNMQMLATRGYAVLFPETPHRIGTFKTDLSENTNAAVNRVVELGIADPERLGVLGQSAGGLAVLALLTETSRFKAAVMTGGFADLVTFYGDLQESGLDAWTSWVEHDAGMGGSPWQYRSRYIENSPIYFLDRVTTPLLIVHGAEDTSVRVEHASQVFSGLRKLGREVEYRKYPGEGHVLQSREHIVDYWNAVILWFDKSVKAAAAKPRR